MKNYNIIAENKKTKKDIEAKIKRITLEDCITIFHPLDEKGTCPLEVNYRIADGYEEHLKDFCPGGRLIIYINELHPRIHMTSPNWAWLTYDVENTNNVLAQLMFNDTMIVIRSD